MDSPDKILKEYIWVFVVGILNISIFATLYYMFGLKAGDEVIKANWYYSYYFSVVTWTTLGYGDLSPVDPLKLVAAFEALLGYIYMAILIGLLMNITQSLKTGVKYGETQQINRDI
jgi:prepilin signal peptidase PulO-like enzyme (type II secretory pathway)